MTVPIITTHASSVAVQDKKDRVLVLGRGAHSKSIRHSPPAGLSGSFTLMERRLRTALSNCNQSYVAHFRKQKTLHTGTWQLECSHYYI